MTNWIAAIVGLFFVFGYCTIQFRRTRDRWYAVALALPIGLAAVSVLLLLSPSYRFLGISWQTWLSAYFVLTGLLVLYAGFRALWPYPFLSAAQAYATALDLREQGNVRRASQVARQLVTFHPKRADARYLMGKLLNEQGKYREAVEQLEIARKLAPEFIGTLLEFGFALKMLGKYRDAISLFEQVLALEPSNSYATNLLSECREKSDDLSSTARP